MQMRAISSWLLALTAAVSPAFSEQLEETAVRFWTLSDVTRIAIETNGEFRFRSDHLYNPDRIFFDLIGAKPRMVPKGMQTIPVGDKFVKRIRVAETQPGMTRVVLDLEAGVEFSASQLRNPDRLMIELRQAAARPVTSNPPVVPQAEPVAVAAVVEKPAVIEKPAINEKPAPSAPVEPVLPPALAAQRPTN